MRLRLVFLGIAVASAVACSGDDDDASPATQASDGSPTATLAATGTPDASATVVFTTTTGNEVDLQVEIADDPDERAQGLMFRESLPENSGMLFVYTEDHIAGFWMKDTLIPLSIAFVTADGTIIDIQDMKPETTESHRPPDLYRNAIEANQGWFERNGIAVGDTAVLPDA